jgi:hypothetical protein
MSSRYSSDEKEPLGLVGSLILAAIGVVTIAVFVALMFGFHAGYKSYHRYQRVQDAKNREKIVQMETKAVAQEVELERQKALIRVEEANGISQAQNIIAGTLTPEYLTYLSIQAQMDFANSNNDTIIYIPVGENGIPLIRDTSQDAQPSSP